MKFFSKTKSAFPPLSSPLPDASALSEPLASVTPLPRLNENQTAYTNSAAATALQELVEKNIKWSQVIYEQNRKLSRRLTVMALGSYIRLALFLAPIILALIFLPPYVRKFLDIYQQFFLTLPTGSAAVSLPGQVNLLEQAQKFINQAGVESQTSAR